MLLFGHSQLQSPNYGKIQEQQDADELCKRLKQYTASGWPSPHTLKGGLEQLWQLCHELCIRDNLLLRGSRIVIPPSLKNWILLSVYSSHQGIAKCRQHFRKSIWWPRLSILIEEMIRDCPVCARAYYNHAEPLFSTTLPDLLRQKVAGRPLRTKRAHVYLGGGLLLKELFNSVNQSLHVMVYWNKFCHKQQSQFFSGICNICQDL